MSKRVEMLTDQTIMQTVPGERPRKMFDGAGLYVILLPSGSKIWRMKYRDQRGKEMTLTFGFYPEVSVKLARQRAWEAREMMKSGTDPRTKFNRTELRPPARVRSRRLLPSSLNRRNLDLYARHIGEESLNHMEALAFPAFRRFSANGFQQTSMLELLEKVKHERGKEVVEILFDICAEVIQSCLDAGIDESMLMTAMTDQRGKTRRLS